MRSTRITDIPSILVLCASLVLAALPAQGEEAAERPLIMDCVTIVRDAETGAALMGARVEATPPSDGVARSAEVKDNVAVSDKDGFAQVRAVVGTTARTEAGNLLSGYIRNTTVTIAASVALRVTLEGYKELVGDVPIRFADEIGAPLKTIGKAYCCLEEVRLVPDGKEGRSHTGRWEVDLSIPVAPVARSPKDRPQIGVLLTLPSVLAHVWGESAPPFSVFAECLAFATQKAMQMPDGMCQHYCELKPKLMVSPGVWSYTATPRLNTHGAEERYSVNSFIIPKTKSMDMVLYTRSFLDGEPLVLRQGGNLRWQYAQTSIQVRSAAVLTVGNPADGTGKPIAPVRIPKALWDLLKLK